MLRQEINLYRQFTTQQTNADLLTWKRYWISNLVALTLLILVYIISLMENVYLKHSVNKTQAQLAQYQSEVAKFKGSLPQLFFTKDASEAIKSMKNEIAAQQEIISILSKHEPFSNILIALSQSIVPNVWLTEISLQKDGDDITLTGNAIGTNVDEFLDKLEKNKLFSLYKIELNELKNKNVDDPNIKLSFEIHLVNNHHG